MSEIELLSRIGEALYGASFSHALARALDVRPSSVHHWVHGKNPIPETLWDELIALMLDRRRLLSDLIGEADFASGRKKLVRYQPLEKKEFRA